MAECSTWVVTMCFLPLVCSADQIAALSLSVPQLVKMISLGVQPSSAATFSRASTKWPSTPLAKAVGAGRVAVIVGEKRHHRLKDLGRDAGGGVVVQVNDFVAGYVHRNTSN